MAQEIQIKGSGVKGDGTRNANATVAEVDSFFRALRCTNRPIDFQNNDGTVGGGHYQLGVSSGLLTSASVIAGKALFSARWSSSTKICIITEVSAYLQLITAMGGVQEIGVDLILARAFTVTDTGGTGITVNPNDMKMRTSHATSAFVSSDMRVGGTTTLTDGTRTLDSNPIIGYSGVNQDPNIAAGTSQVKPHPQIGFNWKANVANGDHPIVLAQNEGIVVRNTITFPAAGTARAWIAMKWAEVPAY